MIALADASWHGAPIVQDDGATAYEMNSGVGQGCTAAAVLFVVGINPLLTALEKHIDRARSESLSACADDVAIVVSDHSRLAGVHDA